MVTLGICTVAILVPLILAIYRLRSRVRRMENRVTGLALLRQAHGRLPDAHDVQRSRLHLVGQEARRTSGIVHFARAHRRSLAIGGGVAVVAVLAAAGVVSAVAAPRGPGPSRIAPRTPNLGALPTPDPAPSTRPHLTPAADGHTGAIEPAGLGGGAAESPSGGSAPTTPSPSSTTHEPAVPVEADPPTGAPEGSSRSPSALPQVPAPRVSLHVGASIS